MAKNYKAIPAVGQLDSTACWAACMKWWYWAAKGVKLKQRYILDMYVHLWEPDGTLSEASIETVMDDSRWGMKKKVFTSPSGLTVVGLKDRLSWGPVYLGHTETSSAKKHVNVIYGIENPDASNPTLLVMEPQAKEKSDGSYKGEHQKKLLSEYNVLGSLYVGSLMPGG